MTPDPEEPSAGQRSLLSGAAGFWLASSAAAVGSLARNKAFALRLGPRGVGLVSQLNLLALAVGTLATLGLANATVKLLGEARARRDAGLQAQLVSTAFLVPLLIGALIVMVAVVASSAIAGATLGRGAYGGYVAVAAASVPFNLGWGSYQITLQGYGRSGRLALASAIVAVLNTAVAIGLLVLFGLPGAIASILITSVVALAVMATRERWVRRLWVRRWIPPPNIRREFTHLGLASVTLAGLASVVDAVLRARTIHLFGLATNGLYQPVALMSSQLFLQLNTGIVLVLLPSLAGFLTQGLLDDAQKRLRRAIRLGTLMSVSATIVVLSAHTALIQVLFSSRFLPASHTMDLQVMGELPRTVLYVVGGVLLPSGRIRAWFVIDLITTFVQAALGWALLPHLGLNGLALAYVAANVAGAVSVWRYVVARSSIRPRRSELLLVASGGAVAMLGYAAVSIGPSLVTSCAVAAVGGSWVFLGLEPEDRLRVLRGPRSWR